MKSSTHLKEVTLKIGSGATPRGGKGSYLSNGDINLIRSQNIYNHKFKRDGLAYISKEQADKLKNVEVFENDILINITGDSIARNMVVHSDMLPARVNQHVSIIRCDTTQLDPYYLSSILTSQKMQNYLISVGQVGATRAALTKKMLEDIEIPICNIEKQHKIGSFLKMLNEKIMLNSKFIETLEEIAASLFENWFVCFEFPNEDRNPYKSSGGKLVASEIGEIPEGWRISSLPEIANYQNGLAMQKFRPKGEASLPVIKIKELSQGFVDTNSERCDVDIKDSVTIYNGDVIFSWSATLLVKIWTGGNGGLNQHLFKVTSDEYPKWFYYYWTKKHIDNFINIAKDKATTMGHINKKHLEQACVLIPNANQMDLFDEIMTPFVDQLLNIGLENETLKELRDTLLPKLLSGEIELPTEAEV